MLLNQINKLSKNTDGSIITLAGIVMPVVVLSSLVTIDYSQKINLKNNLHNSLDTAVLAATSTLTDTVYNKTKIENIEEKMKDTFFSYFDANFSYKNKTDTIPKVRYEFDGSSRIIASAEVEYWGVASKLIPNYNPVIKVKSESKAIITDTKYVIDIVMCIDASSSMDATIRAAVKRANNFSPELKKHLDIDNKDIKIRVKPIFFRDWYDTFVVENPNSDPYYNSWLISRGVNMNTYKGGLIEHEGFIDLDPNEANHKTSSSLAEAELTAFLSSVKSHGGGYDTAEAITACLNEGMRSSWYDVELKKTRKDFNIPKWLKIISGNEAVPVDDNYVKIEHIPVIVTWTDAWPQGLEKQKKYLSPTLPKSYDEFKKIWQNPKIIGQKNKMMLHFGYRNGWNTLKRYEGYNYGGSLRDGNKNGIKILAEKIRQKIKASLALTF